MNTANLFMFQGEILNRIKKVYRTSIQKEYYYVVC